MSASHACEVPGCAFTTTSKSGLSKHVRTHSDERPYLCRAAGSGAAFKQSSAMYRHEKHQHRSPPPQASAALQCASGGCNYVATSLDNLRRHRKSMHHPASGALWCKACGFIDAQRHGLAQEAAQRPAVARVAAQRCSGGGGRGALAFESRRRRHLLAANASLRSGCPALPPFFTSVASSHSYPIYINLEI